MITWVGFAGCTAYFASGKHGLEGFKTAIFSTMSGMISAIIAIIISSQVPGSVAVSAQQLKLLGQFLVQINEIGRASCRERVSSPV